MRREPRPARRRRECKKRVVGRVASLFCTVLQRWRPGRRRKWTRGVIRRVSSLVSTSSSLGWRGRSRRQFILFTASYQYLPDFVLSSSPLALSVPSHVPHHYLQNHHQPCEFHMRRRRGVYIWGEQNAQSYASARSPLCVKCMVLYISQDFRPAGIVTAAQRRPRATGTQARVRRHRR